MLTSTPSWSQPVCASPGCNPTTSDANSNTAGGTGALSNLAAGGISNTAFGRDALNGNTTGDSNTATGRSALVNNTTGAFNTASGAGALFNNTSGTENTASGVSALQGNTTGITNTATGRSTLALNTTGSFNTANGAFALFGNTVGTDNTASGANALESNTIGNLNTASGFQALQGNSAGLQNTAIGAKALKKSTGTKNIGIGFQAGVSLVVGNNNIYIGNQGAGDEFQTIRIGTAQTQTFIAGIAGANPSNSEMVAIDPATGQLGTTQLSSARYKQDIVPMGARSEGVLQLRPITFSYKDDAKSTLRYGLVAEEVAALYPQLVTYASTGEVRSVKYQELIPMLLNELQRQQKTLQRQEEGLSELLMLRKELAELRALVGSRLEK